MSSDELRYDDAKGKERQLPCNSCDNKTYHEVMSSISRNQTDEYTTLYEEFEIVMCRGCRTVSFRANWVFSEDEYVDPATGEVKYAQHVELYPNRVLGRRELKGASLLPEKLLRIYKETRSVLASKAPILTGVGIRTLVEAICEDKKAAGGNLEDKINDLVRLGVLTNEGAAILHGTRLMGNKAAHKLFAASDAQLDAAMNLVEHVLLSAYILKKTSRVLPKRKKRV